MPAASPSALLQLCQVPAGMPLVAAAQERRRSCLSVAQGIEVPNPAVGGSIAGLKALVQGS